MTLRVPPEHGARMERSQPRGTTFDSTTCFMTSDRPCQCQLPNLQNRGTAEPTVTIALGAVRRGMKTAGLGVRGPGCRHKPCHSPARHLNPDTQLPWLQNGQRATCVPRLQGGGRETAAMVRSSLGPSTRQMPHTVQFF